MGKLRGVVYLTSEQYRTLLTEGSITIGGVTHTYNTDFLYCVPKTAEAPANTLYETTISMGIGQTEWPMPEGISKARIKFRPYSASSIASSAHPDAEGRWTDLYISGIGQDAHLFFTWQSSPNALSITDYGNTSAYSGYGGITVHYIKEDNVIKLWAAGPAQYISPAENLIVEVEYTLS